MSPNYAEAANTYAFAGTLVSGLTGALSGFQEGVEAMAAAAAYQAPAGMANGTASELIGIFSATHSFAGGAVVGGVTAMGAFTVGYGAGTFVANPLLNFVSTVLEGSPSSVGSLI